MLKNTFIFTFVFLLSSLAIRSNELLKKAEAAYGNRQYKTAIESYEELIKEGYKSDKLFFNLGNAYYKNNQLGKAIYNYELAKKMNPNDEDVKNNLALAYSKTIDKIETKENFFISAVKNNVLSSFSTSSWAWFSIILFSAAFLFLFIFISSPSLGLKRFSFFIALLALVGFFIVYFLGYSAVKAKEQNNFAIITSPQAKVFTEPSVASASKFGLHEGTRVRIIELNSDWVLIKLENGNEGWLKSSEVGVF